MIHDILKPHIFYAKGQGLTPGTENVWENHDIISAITFYEVTVDTYNITFRLLGTTIIFVHEIPYTAKLSRGKTFAVVHKTHYSLENFHGASGPCHYVLYTANDSRGKLSRLAEKP